MLEVIIIIINYEVINIDSNIMSTFKIGPGAGKSSISSVLCAKLNERGYESVVLPMDGYHYSRSQLQQIAMSNPETSYDQLLIRRGAEWTFDAELFVNDLTDAKLSGVASLCNLREDSLWLST